MVLRFLTIGTDQFFGGGSHANIDDYEDLLTSQPSGTIICGFSLGAIVAAHHADKIAAETLYLFGLNPFADDPSKAAGRRDLAQDVADLGGAAALTTRLPTMMEPNSDAAHATIVAMANEAAHDIEAQTNLALNRLGARTALGRSQSTIVTLTGSEDQMAPKQLGMAAADFAPYGSFRLLDGLGHYALLEDPRACAQAVLEAEDSLE